ncbi:MAG: iron-sulfur cluster-binding domain-containing protein [Clostridiales bacterium]|nr:iron-sulfur cluster-binding domain-containing protein [Clostridiales bacterium]
MKQFNFHVKPIGLLDMLHFKKLVPNRAEKLAEGANEQVTSVYKVNRMSEFMHPATQMLTIDEIIAHDDDTKTFILTGQYIAPFRAGQYLSVYLTIGESVITRPYSISSSPQWTKEGKYAVTVKRASDGFASDWILSNWKVGIQVTTSGPEGNFYYEPLRDAGHVIGVAGGSGITPFLSMAYAIRDGLEDFNLTLLYGSCAESDILYKLELAEIEKNCDKVKIIHVLSEEKTSCYEYGFITSELIKKYGGDHPYSIFLCGPPAMYNFVDKEIEKLKLESKYVRHELFTSPASPAGLDGYEGDVQKQYVLTVKRFGEQLSVPMKASETVLVALERAGIAAPSRCRGGECGWCRARLDKGETFTPSHLDGRRMADKTTGHIHPCCAYPLSDLTIDICPE